LVGLAGLFVVTPQAFFLFETGILSSPDTSIWADETPAFDLTLAIFNLAV
jgi:hypothetical protein